MAWFGLAKIALQAGSKIYSNRQRTKMAMSDAQLMHALPIVVLAWSVWTEDPAAMEKIDIFFQYFSNLPKWFTNLWILVVASVFGIKGTQVFRNGNSKK